LHYANLTEYAAFQTEKIKTLAKEDATTGFFILQTEPGYIDHCKRTFSQILQKIDFKVDSVTTLNSKVGTW
jgi:hypothetical protein